MVRRMKIIYKINLLWLAVTSVICVGNIFLFIKTVLARVIARRQERKNPQLPERDIELTNFNTPVYPSSPLFFA